MDPGKTDGWMDGCASLVFRNSDGRSKSINMWNGTISIGYSPAPTTRRSSYRSALLVKKSNGRHFYFEKNSLPELPPIPEFLFFFGVNANLFVLNFFLLYFSHTIEPQAVCGDRVALIITLLGAHPPLSRRLIMIEPIRRSSFSVGFRLVERLSFVSVAWNIITHTHTHTQSCCCCNRPS